MINASDIREHMEVVGSDGKHVGRVDHVDGDRIELAKLDVTTMGRHRLVPLSWVELVDEKVHLSMPHEQAVRRWSSEH